MKAIISTLQEVDIRFLAIDAGVRYWEDGKINGRQDDADAPSMPFSESGRWRIIIDIDSGGGNCQLAEGRYGIGSLQSMR